VSADRTGAVRAEQVQVLEGVGGPELPALVTAGGRAWAVVWPGTGARLRSMHRIALAEGGETRRLRHPGEAVYYVIEGEGEVEDLERGSSDLLVEGSMVHVDAGTPYLLRARSGALELVGGPAPADPGLYRQKE
jgi:quercetin dioxygenase-like cupin family protein